MALVLAGALLAAMVAAPGIASAKEQLGGGGETTAEPVGFFDVRAVGEPVRFSGATPFLPGTPVADQGVGLTAAEASSNGSAAFAAAFYPGALIEAVPGVAALLELPISPPALYTYIAHSSNPGPADSEQTPVEPVAVGGFTASALASRAKSPSRDASQALAALTDVTESEGSVTVAGAWGSSTVEPFEGGMRANVLTRLQGLDIAGGLVSVESLVSAVDVRNSGPGTSPETTADSKVAGVKVAGIPVTLSDNGVAVGPVAEDPALQPMVDEVVQNFQLEIKLAHRDVEQSSSSDSEGVEVALSALTVSATAPKELVSLPVPVVQSLLPGTKFGIKVGYAAVNSRVASSASFGDSPSLTPDAAAAVVGGGSEEGGAALESSAGSSASVGPESTLEAESGVDSPDPSSLGGPTPTAPSLGPGELPDKAPLLFSSASPATDPRGAYLFVQAVLATAIALAGWRLLIYRAGPVRQ